MWLKACFIASLLCIVSAERSYYKVLGVSQRANDDTIKQSYRKLAKQLHPDKNRNDPNAQDKFIELSTAYETLSDSSKRRDYDDSLRYGGGSGMNHNNNQHQHNPFPHGSRFHSPPSFGQDRGRGGQRGGSTFTFRGPNGQYYYSSSTPGGNPFQQFHQQSSDPQEFSWTMLVFYVLRFMITNFSSMFTLLIIVGLWGCAACTGYRDRRRDHMRKQRTAAYTENKTSSNSGNEEGASVPAASATTSTTSRPHSSATGSVATSPKLKPVQFSTFTHNEWNCVIGSNPSLVAPSNKRFITVLVFVPLTTEEQKLLLSQFRADPIVFYLLPLHSMEGSSNAADVYSHRANQKLYNEMQQVTCCESSREYRAMALRPPSSPMAGAPSTNRGKWAACHMSSSGVEMWLLSLLGGKEIRWNTIS